MTGERDRDPYLGGSWREWDANICGAPTVCLGPYLCFTNLNPDNPGEDIISIYTCGNSAGGYVAELSDPTAGLLSAIQIGSPGRVWWGALGMRSLGGGSGPW